MLHNLQENSAKPNKRAKHTCDLVSVGQKLT